MDSDFGGSPVVPIFPSRHLEALQSGRVDRQQLAYFCRLEPTGRDTVDAEAGRDAPWGADAEREEGKNGLTVW